MQSDVICWILLTLFIGVFADERQVKQDSLVCLFQNVTADNADNDVRLYDNTSGKPIRIVIFTFVNGHISMEWDPHMADNYSKIFMDAKRNICIANIDETYEKKFYIQSSKKLGEVELTILKTSFSQNCNESVWISPGFCIASHVLLALAIIVFIIIIIVKKTRNFWIKRKKCNSINNQQANGSHSVVLGNNKRQQTNGSHSVDHGINNQQANGSHSVVLDMKSLASKDEHNSNKNLKKIPEDISDSKDEATPFLSRTSAVSKHMTSLASKDEHNSNKNLKKIPEENPDSDSKDEVAVVRPISPAVSKKRIRRRKLRLRHTR